MSDKIIQIAKEAGAIGMEYYEGVYVVNAMALSRFRDLVLEEALNCYSPDDTAQDWEDKIEALKESK